MFARFANPHALELLTKVTSRRELHASDDEGNDEEDREAIARLETLLKRSLDASGSAPDAPKKKKRRKLADVEPEGESSAPEPQLAVPFRLLSASIPPRAVILEPKPPRVVKRAERQCEDNAREADERSARAHAAAVDVSWIIRESANPPAPSPKVKVTRATLDIQAVDQPQNPTLALLSCPLLPRRPPPNVSAHPAPQPSPHLPRMPASGASHCPLLSLVQSSPPAPKPSVGQARRRRARRRKEAGHARPPPAFFRPQPEWGGKSAGYAWGFGASAPRLEGVGEEAPSGREGRYERDKMRKGVTMDALDGCWRDNRAVRRR